MHDPVAPRADEENVGDVDAGSKRLVPNALYAQQNRNQRHQQADSAKYGYRDQRMGFGSLR